MELYMYYFFVLKTIITIAIILMFFGKISSHGPLYIIIDTIFKVSLGIYIILFFGYQKLPNLDPHDRLLLIISGFILLITINYKEAYGFIIGENVSEVNPPVHVVSKPCPPCDRKDIIHGRIMH
jgi:hypothetical protein